MKVYEIRTIDKSSKKGVGGDEKHLYFLTWPQVTFLFLSIPCLLSKTVPPFTSTKIAVFCI